MINYFSALVYGIVQGVTEFLPVSSSGHLVVLHEFLKIPLENDLVFDVTLHFATLLAVLYFFRQDIKQLFQGWIQNFGKNKNENGRISWLIILGTIPAALIGFLFADKIELYLRSPKVVIVMLSLVGLAMILVERLSVRQAGFEILTWKKTLLIGLAQALALIPGTSRSGITIIAGMFLGLKRAEAIRFSFLLSAPIIFGAAIKEIPHLIKLNLGSEELFLIVIAFFSALISGILVIKYFLIFAKRYRLDIFAWYRFALAIMLGFYIFLK